MTTAAPRSNTQLEHEAPLISVIVPVYNCAHFIADALDSIFAQNYPKLEVLVIDDCSSDDIHTALAPYLAKIKLLQQTSNQGAAAARNRGLSVAQGQYIAFLDGDDVWLPGKLKQQVDFLEAHPEYGVVHASFYRWYPDASGYFSHPSKISVHTPSKLIQQASGHIYPKILLRSEVCIICALVRAELVQQIGGFEANRRQGEDYNFWIRSSRICQIARLEGYVALYRYNRASTTIRSVSDTPYELEVIRDAIARWGYASPCERTTNSQAIKQRFAQLHFDHGYQHFFAGKASIARTAFYQCLHYNPYNFKAWLYLAASGIKNLVKRI